MIKDIQEEGKICIPCLITRCDKAKTVKGTPYLSLTLEDSSGVLDAKFWNLTEQRHQNNRTKSSTKTGPCIRYQSHNTVFRIPCNCKCKHRYNNNCKTADFQYLFFICVRTEDVFINIFGYRRSSYQKLGICS